MNDALGGAKLSIPGKTSPLVWEPSRLHNLLSGRRRRLGATLLRGGLRLAETPYAWAMRWRNHRYDSGAAGVHRLDVPVISVGNLTTGGTGKTPLVFWLAQWFRGRAIPVAVVSRGYRAPQSGQRGDHGEQAENDEARELAARLPDVPHLQNPDRVAAARQAVRQFRCGAIILDNAFQHRRIGRDLDIVVLDALEPLGFGHLLPRGLLREPVEGLRRADLVALARADVLAPHHTRRTASSNCPNCPAGGLAGNGRRSPGRCSSSTGGEEPIESFHNRPVAAFCGIGNPAGFRHTLASCGYRVAGFREFPDHHAYTPRDLAALARWAADCGAAAVLCTQKDLVKLPVDRLGDLPLRAVAIDLEILAEREFLEARLDVLARKSVSPLPPGEG